MSNKPVDRAIPIITFDGPSGSGKGTLSRAVAAERGWHLLDSGALYRLLAIAAEQQGLSADDDKHIARVADMARELDVQFAVVGEHAEEQIRLAGQDVTAAVRSEAAGNTASHFAAKPRIREALLELQRNFQQPPGLVADGRDMGTVVFPQARFKFFLTASAGERALRRYDQLSEKGVSASIDRIYSEIVARDERDKARAHSPLKPAPDAKVIDTTGMGVEQTLIWVREAIREQASA